MLLKQGMLKHGSKHLSEEETQPSFDIGDILLKRCEILKYESLLHLWQVRSLKREEFAQATCE